MSWFQGIARSAAALATGILGWSPDSFWDATVAELQSAIDGRLGDKPVSPLGRAEMAALETKVDSDGR